MKEEILDITDKLKKGDIDSNQAKNLLLSLFGSCFVSVEDKQPPHNIEILAKSPSGIVYLSSWRAGYNIFSCQAKTESSIDWKWKHI